MFVRMNGIKHIRCPPYHPATNGLVERFVQSLKAALKASLNSGLPLHRRVLNFLFTYRSTPHTTTGVSPSSLFLHRRIRTRLDLLHPNSESAGWLSKHSRNLSMIEELNTESSLLVKL